VTDDDPDKTPTQTPSAMLRLGLSFCPKCTPGGIVDYRVDCDLCGNARRVPVDVAIQWGLDHGDTQPPPPEVK